MGKNTKSKTSFAAKIVNSILGDTWRSELGAVTGIQKTIMSAYNGAFDDAFKSWYTGLPELTNEGALTLPEGMEYELPSWVEALGRRLKITIDPSKVIENLDWWDLRDSFTHAGTVAATAVATTNGWVKIKTPDTTESTEK